MKRSTHRILTTHTGNLHRPDGLENLFKAKLHGQPYDAEAYAMQLRSGVAEVVRKQAELGVDVVDDGEYGKSSFSAYPRHRLTGLERRPPPPGAPVAVLLGKSQGQFSQFHQDTVPPGAGPFSPGSMNQGYVPLNSASEPPGVYVCVGPLTYNSGEITRDIDNFQAGLKGVTVGEGFMPLVAPGQLAIGQRNEYYSTDEQYYEALANALHQEYEAVVKAGFVLQIDDCSMPLQYMRLDAQGKLSEYPKWAGMAVEALNHALAGIPEDRVRYHMCWGSSNSPHVDDAPLSAMLGDILRVRAQGHQLEAANSRHEHEWKVWKGQKLTGKVLLPGVVSHATNVIEHPDLVADRIGRFASIIGRENVIAATDCGFRLRVHPQIAWAKLNALAQGARVATTELW